MKPAKYDPILIEMHRVKDSISAAFNHDVDALFDHLRKLDVQAIAQSGPVVVASATVAQHLTRKSGKSRSPRGK